MQVLWNATSVLQISAGFETLFGAEHHEEQLYGMLVPTRSFVLDQDNACTGAGLLASLMTFCAPNRELPQNKPS